MILPIMHPYKWTRQEYNEMAANGMFHPEAHHELVNGDIIDRSQESSLHSSALKIADNTLRSIIPDNYHIRIQIPLALEPNSEPEPDIAIVSKLPERDQEKTLLVIEISEACSILFNRKIKKKLYASYGIPEYWIINLEILCVEVHRNPFQDSYTQMKVLHGSDIISPLFNPELSIFISDILV